MPATSSCPTCRTSAAPALGDPAPRLQHRSRAREEHARQDLLRARQHALMTKLRARSSRSWPRSAAAGGERRRGAELLVLAGARPRRDRGPRGRVRNRASRWRPRTCATSMPTNPRGRALLDKVLVRSSTPPAAEPNPGQVPGRRGRPQQSRGLPILAEELEQASWRCWKRMDENGHDERRRRRDADQADFQSARKRAGARAAATTHPQLGQTLMPNSGAAGERVHLGIGCAAASSTTWTPTDARHPRPAPRWRRDRDLAETLGLGRHRRRDSLSIGGNH